MRLAHPSPRRHATTPLHTCIALGRVGAVLSSPCCCRHHAAEAGARRHLQQLRSGAKVFERAVELAQGGTSLGAPLVGVGVPGLGVAGGVAE
jgi:hypothetical protein